MRKLYIRLVRIMQRMKNSRADQGGKSINPDMCVYGNYCDEPYDRKKVWTEHLERKSHYF